MEVSTVDSCQGWDQLLVNVWYQGKKVSRLKLRKPSHNFLSFGSSPLHVLVETLNQKISAVSKNLENFDVFWKVQNWSLSQLINKNKLVLTVEKETKNQCFKNVKTFIKSQSPSILTVFGREVQAYKLPSMYGGLFRMHK